SELWGIHIGGIRATDKL
nr:T cell receptor delta 6 {V-D-J junction} [mice, intestinal intraepithelial lymphocytes, Peptide Partial, 17 aa] [Mus sp.]